NVDGIPQKRVIWAHRSRTVHATTFPRVQGHCRQPSAWPLMVLTIPPRLLIPAVPAMISAPRAAVRWMFCLTVWGALLAPAVAGEARQVGDSAPARPAQAPVVERHVQPIFQQHCVRCHNDVTSKAELVLSSAAGVFRGGESGATVVPGSLKESLLYDMVHEG